MSIKYGVQRTKANAGTGQQIIKPGVCLGRLRTMIDVYAADGAADLLAGDVIQMGVPLPKGAHVVEVTLINEAMGGDVEVSVGDAESSARYIPQTAVHAAAAITAIVAAEAVNLPYEVDMSHATDADNQILVTVVVGTSNTDLKKLITIVKYTQD